MTGWQLISTMPKNPSEGMRIRIRNGQWEPCHAHFHNGRWQVIEYIGTLSGSTHWQQITEAK